MSHYTPTLANRAQPSAQWIEKMRASYPVESAVDEVFTRKLHSRLKPVEHTMDFSKLQQPLLEFLQGETGQADIVVANLKRLPGGASKEQFTFDLTWQPEPGKRETRRLMIRMDPTESIVETHRLRESQVLRAMWGEVPVPEVLWIDPLGEQLGHPALIASFLEGTVQPEQPENSEKMSGVGMYFKPELRDGLSQQFVDILAKIHAIDWRKKDLSTFDIPQSNSTQANEWAIGLWERAWNEDTLSAHPIMERAVLWLKENMPVVGEPVIVHGDYRTGNFMYTDDLEINAIFDWELAYYGDYHDDLSWATLGLFGGSDEEGKPLSSSLMYQEDFLARYERASGNKVDMKKLSYYHIFSYYKIAVIAAATSVRVAYSRRTHLDAMMNFASGLGSVATSELNRLLDKATA
ncbi:MAG: phosphotransferase family protein [Gammaproteobacteria bacterium]|nr:phosphotransferase family protein [Gammaproteobacteria bacterium]MBQ0840299.1 phosphotransferase family protein [Gammaproteobacteria bacterium]